jgi:ATP-dependent Lhr-like helicase
MEGEDDGGARSLSRSVGASVILRNGACIAYLRRNNPNVLVFLPSEEPERSHAARDLAAFLVGMAQNEMRREDESHSRGGLLISTINAKPAHQHFLLRFLQDAGFQAAPLGLNVRRIPQSVQPPSAEVQ